MESYYHTWLWESVLGLLLIGTGLSVLGHSIILKASRTPPAKWVLWGTLSLILVCGGVSIFGDAVKQRVLYEAARTKVPERG